MTIRRMDRFAIQKKECFDGSCPHCDPLSPWTVLNRFSPSFRLSTFLYPKPPIYFTHASNTPTRNRLQE
nr:MAG TPA: protein of unknown function (DUF5332) [Caudoviricetes sp.]